QQWRLSEGGRFSRQEGRFTADGRHAGRGAARVVESARHEIHGQGRGRAGNSAGESRPADAVPQERVGWRVGARALGDAVDQGREWPLVPGRADALAERRFYYRSPDRPNAISEGTPRSGEELDPRARGIDGLDQRAFARGKKSSQPADRERDEGGVVRARQTGE